MNENAYQDYLGLHTNPKGVELVRELASVCRHATVVGNQFLIPTLMGILDSAAPAKGFVVLGEALTDLQQAQELLACFCYVQSAPVAELGLGVKIYNTTDLLVLSGYHPDIDVTEVVSKIVLADDLLSDFGPDWALEELAGLRVFSRTQNAPTGRKIMVSANVVATALAKAGV